MNNQRNIMAKRVHIPGALLCLSSIALIPGIALAEPVEETTNTTVSYVGKLQPFTHIASIPSNADPASIRFEGVKATKVATQLKATTEASYCSTLDEKTSLYCPYEQLQSYVPAYEVTYSYLAPAADEFGNRRSTFQIYLHPEELPTAFRDALAGRRVKRDSSAKYFTVKTLNDPIQRVVVDEATSNFCIGNFVDGSWTHKDSRCEDKIGYKGTMTPPDSLSVKVEPISLPGVQATNRIRK